MPDELIAKIKKATTFNQGYALTELLGVAGLRHPSEVTPAHIHLRGEEGSVQTFEERLPNEVQLFIEYHALIVQHAKTFCKKRPACEQCCLRRSCAFVS